MSPNPLHEEYGRLSFELKVIQARLAELEQRLVQEHNQATVPKEGDAADIPPGHEPA